MEDTSLSSETSEKLVFSIPWLIYLLFFTLVFVPSLLEAFTTRTAVGFLDLAVSFPSLIGLAFFTFKKEWGHQIFWEVYSVLFPIYDIVKNVFTARFIPGCHFSTEALIGGVIMLPIYIALLLFAYKKDTNKNKQDDLLLKPVLS